MVPRAEGPEGGCCLEAPLARLARFAHVEAAAGSSQASLRQGRLGGGNRASRAGKGQSPWRCSHVHWRISLAGE